MKNPKFFKIIPAVMFYGFLQNIKKIHLYSSGKYADIKGPW
jgi:hypothetical protein